MDADEVMVAAARFIADDKPWDAIEVMRRWVEEAIGSTEAQSLSEIQGRVKKPWQ